MLVSGLGDRKEPAFLEVEALVHDWSLQPVSGRVAKIFLKIPLDSKWEKN